MKYKQVVYVPNTFPNANYKCFRRDLALNLLLCNKYLSICILKKQKYIQLSANNFITENGLLFFAKVLPSNPYNIQLSKVVKWMTFCEGIHSTYFVPSTLYAAMQKWRPQIMVDLHFMPRSGSHFSRRRSCFHDYKWSSFTFRIVGKMVFVIQVSNESTKLRRGFGKNSKIILNFQDHFVCRYY